MNNNFQNLNPDIRQKEENYLQGAYGPYLITASDELEVQRYRFSLLVCGISYFLGLIHWILLGSSLAWIWLIPMSISLGLALKWIHIYLIPLHKTLQLLWAIGCLGCGIMALNLGPQEILSSLHNEPKWIFIIGPLFASMTGVGFKEFFCFGRTEAIGVTLLVPIALLGHLTKFLGNSIVLTLLTFSSILLIVLALRKFGMDPAADVGDKSIFTYLSEQN